MNLKHVYDVAQRTGLEMKFGDPIEALGFLTLLYNFAMDEAPNGFVSAAQMGVLWRLCGKEPEWCERMEVALQECGIILWGEWNGQSGYMIREWAALVSREVHIKVAGRWGKFADGSDPNLSKALKSTRSRFFVPEGFHVLTFRAPEWRQSGAQTAPKRRQALECPLAKSGQGCPHGPNPRLHDENQTPREAIVSNVLSNPVQSQNETLDLLGDPAPASSAPEPKAKKKAKTQVPEGKKVNRYEYSVGFESWWKHYPQKQRSDKPATYDVWRQKGLEEEWPEWVQNIVWQLRVPELSSEGGKYFPAAEIYLRKDRHLIKADYQQKYDWYFSQDMLDVHYGMYAGEPFPETKKKACPYVMPGEWWLEHLGFPFLISKAPSYALDAFQEAHGYSAKVVDEWIMDYEVQRWRKNEEEFQRRNEAFDAQLRAEAEARKASGVSEPVVDWRTMIASNVETLGSGMATEE